jgi:hypothetical protein
VGRHLAPRHHPLNVFLKWEEVRRVVQLPPFTVKLGDFGCAVTDWEFASTECEFDIDYLPCIDESYAPPEGAEPTEAADIFQIGLILSQMYCMTDNPANGLNEDAIHPCVAGHFSIRAFGVRTARLHKVEFNVNCSAHVFL